MIKFCKGCNKKIYFIAMDISLYSYKDELGYYCSYNCYRSKGMFKDGLLNTSCLGEEKEKDIAELTKIYYLESGENSPGIANYRAITELCTKKELEKLLQDEPKRLYYEKLKKADAKRMDSEMYR